MKSWRRSPHTYDVMTFDLFIDRISENQRAVVFVLDDMFLSFPGIMRKIRFRIPFYDYKSWVCYLNPVKGDGIELCFLYGVHLSNTQNVLQDKGRKQVAGITFYKPEDIDDTTVMEIFAEATLLDETLKKKK